MFFSFKKSKSFPKFMKNFKPAKQHEIKWLLNPLPSKIPLAFLMKIVECDQEIL